jgi:hypothetical protein
MEQSISVLCCFCSGDARESIFWEEVTTLFCRNLLVVEVGVTAASWTLGPPIGEMLVVVLLCHFSFCGDARESRLRYLEEATLFCCDLPVKFGVSA